MDGWPTFWGYEWTDGNFWECQKASYIQKTLRHIQGIKKGNDFIIFFGTYDRCKHLIFWKYLLLEWKFWYFGKFFGFDQYWNFGAKIGKNAIFKNFQFCRLILRKKF